MKWNFTKFLIDRSGEVLKRFESNQTPQRSNEIVAALRAPPPVPWGAPTN